MTRVMESIYRLEISFDEKAEHFTYCHPFIATFAMTILTPILLLAAVFISTTAIMLPISWILGWI